MSRTTQLDPTAGGAAGPAKMPATVSPGDVDPGSGAAATLDAADLGVTLSGPPPVVRMVGSLASLGLGLADRAGRASSSVLPRLDPDGEGFQLTGSSGPRYAALRILGRGGMGEVDLVEDRDIGRTVARKRLLPEATNPGHLARFVDEVRVIGRLEHPNIVPIHDVGLDDQGRYFFVMKFVDGETLVTIIERLANGDPDAVAQYDVTRRVQIFVGLLRALEYAHASGVLHRDLKPANVMVGRFGEVVLMDWGVACTLDRRSPGAPVGPGAHLAEAHAGYSRLSSTQVGALVGTPLYMSPEQAQGANGGLDERSDLYSGCVLFHELLGLRHRHVGEASLRSVLMAVNSAEPPAHSAVFEPHPSQPGGVGAEYAHFLRRGLARDPGQRWQSARQMIDELHAIQSGYCRIQCPVTLMKRTTAGVGRFIDRRPYVALAGATIATLTFLVLLVVLVGSLVR